MKKITIFLILTISLVQGCITRHEIVNVTSAYPFERRYDKSDKIVVNGERIEIPKNKSVWILSNDTLNNLLIYSNGKEVKQ